jgi:hypothetical protein
MTEREPINDELLDRLVDGELSLDEEHHLLRALEEAPGAWRRCALTFVEAAAWRRELAGVRAESVHGSKRAGAADDAGAISPAVGQSIASPFRGRSLRIYPLLAVAASVALAFAAGWLLPRAVRDGQMQPQDLIAESDRGPSAEQLVAPSRPVLAESRWPGVLDPNQVMALVVTQPDGSERPVLVPLLDEHAANRLAGGITEAGFSSALPPSVRRQLEQAGFRIELRRRYAPLPLDRDRHLIVPVEDTQIVPVRAGVY